MDIQTVFRNLVSNQYMPDFDYSNTNFTFRTVFHLSNHAYCVCMCCYEHEHLDYVSDQGEIDEEKYNRVLKCIVDGKCPHVNQVPEEYVKETSISGIYIAAALGTMEALRSGNKHHYSWIYLHSERDNLTGVNPHVLGLLHNAVTASVSGLKFGLLHMLTQIHYGKRNREKDAIYEIYIEQTKLLVLLAKQGNTPCFVNYPKTYSILLDLKAVTDIFQLTLKHKLNKLQYEILDFLRYKLNKPQYAIPGLKKLCELAIIWNLPEILDQILAMVKQTVLQQYFKDKSTIEMLSMTCLAFQRNECKDILLKNGISIVNVSDRNHYEWMIRLLTKSWQSINSSKMKKVFSMGKSTVSNTHISEQFSRGLLTAPSLSDNSGKQQDDQQYSVFHHYHSLLHDSSKFEREPTPSEDITHVLSWIIDSGLDLNVRDSKSDSSPFEDFLSTCTFPEMCLGPESRQLYMQQYYLQHRQTAEVYIYNNPDLNQQKLVPTALRNDANLYNSNYFFNRTDWQLFSTFAGRGIPVKMDCKQHAIFGHDDKENFALNFMAPLLVECGFAITAEGRKDFLENLQESLHPTEVDYLKVCLDNPRTLKLCCRDGLRKHFRGRLIHKFVEASEIPQGIKDYVLLKPLLKSIPKQIFH